MAKAVQMAVEPFDFILDSDKELPPDEQSTFTFTPLSQREYLAAIDSAEATTRGPDGGLVYSSRALVRAYDLVLDHLDKVSNFPAGEPKPWPKTRQARIEYMKQFAPLDLFYMANVIINRTTLGETEKNF